MFYLKPDLHHTSQLHISKLCPYILGAQTTKHRDGLGVKAGQNTWQGEESLALMIAYLVSLFWRHFIKYPTFCSELNIENRKLFKALSRALSVWCLGKTDLAHGK